MLFRDVSGAVLMVLVVLLAAKANAVPEDQPGARLVRENNCIACHRLGTGPLPRDVPRVGPDLSRAGFRLNPGWVMSYLRFPKKLRPANPARMPNFRLSESWAADLTAYLVTRKESWPELPEGKKREGEGIAFPSLYGSLPPGNAERGKADFERFECSKCHGNLEKAGEYFGGKPEERGPDLREMARKLTRMGVASMLFQPDFDHGKTKMPAFFYDRGEALDDWASQQIADVVAFIRSLAGIGPAKFSGGDAAVGREIAGQFNCAGCHDGLGVLARRQDRVALSLGYRNAPRAITREIVASWIRRPVTISMHEQRHGMGRMPTFGFTPIEVDQIVSYLFSFEGPQRAGSGMMMERGMGRRRMWGWGSRFWNWLAR